MTVGEAVAACEYMGCKVVDQLGGEIYVTKKNCEGIYQRTVERLSAKDSIVYIWTFDKMEEMARELEAQKAVAMMLLHPMLSEVELV